MRHLAWLLVGLAATAAAAPPKIPPTPPWRAPTARESFTPNGIRVLALPDRQLPLVHVTVAVQASPALDPDDKPGLACAVATMLQDGGAGVHTAPELAQAMEGLGSELEIQCDRAGTRLAMTVMAGQLDRALALLGDLVGRPTLDEIEWQRTRARRVAELVRQRSEPRAVADLVFDRALFGDHPYGRPMLGTPAAVEKLSIQELRDFYTAHYGPRATTVILVGDVAPEAAAPAVAKAFGDWHAAASPSPPPPAPARRPGRVVLVDRPGAPQSEVRVGHLGVARATPDFAAIKLLEMVLGGSFTSRLVQNLREKHGYTYGIGARFLMLRAPGSFVVRSAVRTDVTAPALAEIVGELRRIRAPIAKAEAAKGRALVENNLVEAYSDDARAANAISELALANLPLDAWSKLPAELQHASPRATSAAAARHFFPDDLTIVIVGDRKAIEPSLRALPFVKSIELADSDGNAIK